ncbi:potassium channel family protein [Halalkalicoccus jeotgali]|uniref:TrkA domain-containing protein n=1 Tax=Halalkalicoccus jeotgali (strain DSM 18796 / CECT 7217 / JCM 14584 / KCTC 4019 / B3) TaxID=795797 RepID=D8J3P6_HALJB|nr:TrkA family potassium uptake protein [Halalkalicoccus jeotgali]ADJ15353.1 TrkA domain-containing protein [Halalkalicoccus jeotgali B3]ELY35434.1 TrkA domain-containing protein [Halalkalicoccus jeotgali B3]
MYLIVVGAGSIGTEILSVGATSGHEIVVIDRDRERAERAGREFDCLVLHADATDREVLREAGADRADAIICTTEADPTNIMVLLLAKELGIPSLISVVQDPQHTKVFEEAGATTLGNPQRLIAEHLYRAAERPSIVDVMHLSGEAEVFEVMVTEGAPIAGRTLLEADTAGLLNEGVLIVAVERGEAVLTPRGETEIHAGDVLTIFSQAGITPAVMGPFEDGRKRRG